MLSRIGAIIRRVRELADPHHWAVKWLGLPHAAPGPSRTGLLMIQVDGLSRTEMERALNAGRMPFLARLRDREGYRTHTLYSGLPSSTPAVQGELFYGVKGAVPAFGFRDPATGEVVSMLDQRASAQVEARLALEGEPLLTGGAAYSDIYAGGAPETHFCPATLAPATLLPSGGQLTLSRYLLMHVSGLVLAAGLAALELVLAVVDCLRGIAAGQAPKQELLFVPARVAICVILRELCVAGVAMDLVRGLPVIHVNLPGFDELAHRRGPTSAFARWCLGGIDRAVERLWLAAHRAVARDYDVWIYSDHGQEETRPFAGVTGRSLEEALALALGQDASRGAGEVPSFQFSAKGPVGQLYVPGGLRGTDRELVASRLVSIGVPLVLARTARGTARAWTVRGTFELPAMAADVLGAGHPFLEEAAVDLAALCNHEAAGDLVLSGFSPGGPQLSFASENGSHAGPGPEETRAFALLPASAPVGLHSSGHLRPLDLRQAALARLGRVIQPRRLRTAGSPSRRTLRLVTYNVHRCRGIDGVLSLDRIARVIDQLDADVVALQELDVGRPRTGAIDQAFELAERLEMQHHFHPAIQIEEEQYGDAVLSRLPTRLVRAAALPGPHGGVLVEPRGALWVAVAIGPIELQLINTHFGLMPNERLQQAHALVGPGWLAHPACVGPVAVLGDFNSTPRSPAYRVIASLLSDAQSALAEHRPRATWFSSWPVGRIDHVFLGAGLTVRAVEVPRSAVVVSASDHLPVVVDVEVDLARHAGAWTGSWPGREAAASACQARFS